MVSKPDQKNIQEKFYGLVYAWAYSGILSFLFTFPCPMARGGNKSGKELIMYIL